jgi:hypothetical protein
MKSPQTYRHSAVLGAYCEHELPFEGPSNGRHAMLAKSHLTATLNKITHGALRGVRGEARRMHVVCQNVAWFHGAPLSVTVRGAVNKYSLPCADLHETLYHSISFFQHFLNGVTAPSRSGRPDYRGFTNTLN